MPGNYISSAEAPYGGALPAIEHYGRAALGLGGISVEFAVREISAVSRAEVEDGEAACGKRAPGDDDRRPLHSHVTMGACCVVSRREGGFPGRTPIRFARLEEGAAFGSERRSFAIAVTLSGPSPVEFGQDSSLLARS
jgi:hypothetical protein